jgi:hypothetical protein
VNQLTRTTGNPLIDCPELVKLVKEIGNRNPEWDDARVFEEVMRTADRDSILRGQLVRRVIAGLLETAALAQRQRDLN